MRSRPPSSRVVPEPQTAIHERQIPKVDDRQIPALVCVEADIAIRARR